jgi:hypothetical protein
MMKSHHTGFKTIKWLITSIFLLCWVLFIAPANAAIAFRAATSAIATSSSGVTVSKPTGTVLNDVMVATIASRNRNLTVNTPTGWTVVNTATQSNGGVRGMLLTTYYKVATASEPSTYTWSFSGGGNYEYAAAGITSFSGVDTTSPINANGAQAAGNGSTYSFATRSITTTVANTMLVGSFSYMNADGWTAPTGFTEALDIRSPSALNQTGITLAMSYKSQATTGSVSATATANNTYTSDYGATQLLALKPSTSTTPTVSIATPAAIAEGNSGTTTLNFTVTLSATSASAVTVTYSTSNGTATGGTCGTAGVDYATVTGGTVSIAAGSTSATIPISICGDTTNEGNETFTVTLTAATNATLSGTTATGTISNDDAASTASCNSGAISGIINTYYTGAASVSSGATSITVGTSSGASTGITAGDLILVMQMQDAAIDVTNSSSYGTSSSMNAG